MNHVSTASTDAITEEALDHLLQTIADGFKISLRAPILHTPADEGLAYEDVTFPSLDGVPLEGWFMPRPGSDKLIIANHPMGFNRAGLPAHLEPWKSLWELTGNGFEVNFLPDYKVLHDAGYAVLAYDLRNHGLSGAAHGGIGSSGVFEARDVVGSLRYARTRTDLRDMSIGLFSRCLGCNATFSAMARYPEEFHDVRCMVGAQPLTTRVFLDRQLTRMGASVDDRLMSDLSARIRAATSFDLTARDPKPWAEKASIPSFLYQVRDDVLTHPSDVQQIFDSIPGDAKQLLWIDGTTRRWDGYLEFQRNPEPMLAWFSAHLA